MYIYIYNIMCVYKIYVYILIYMGYCTPNWTLAVKRAKNHKQNIRSIPCLGSFKFNLSVQ